MSEKQETSADIIAEMRLGATGDMPFAYRIGRPDIIVEYKTEDGKKYVQRSVVIESVTIDELADRLEAATRRDCAKLREAVKAVVDVGYPHNFQHEAPHIRGYCYDITEAIKKCFDALATEKEGGDK